MHVTTTPGRITQVAEILATGILRSRHYQVSGMKKTQSISERGLDYSRTYSANTDEEGEKL